MNLLQLFQRLKVECGVSGTTPSTALAQTGEYGRLVSWINTAWMDIQMMRPDWDWLRGDVAFPTVTGSPTYTAAQTGLTDFAGWVDDSFRNYVNPAVTVTIATPGVVTLATHGLSVNDTVKFATTGALPTGLVAGTTYYVKTVVSTSTFTLSATAGGTAIATSGSQSGTHTITSNNTTIFVGLSTEIFMEHIGYQEWRDGYEFGALRQVQSRPTVITVTPNAALGLGPFPVSGYTVVGEYFKIPTEMALDADIPVLPTQYHMAIVYRAMMSYGQYEQAQEVVLRGQAEFDRMIRRLAADRLQEMTVGGALA